MTTIFSEPDHARLVRRLSAVTGGDLTGPQIAKLAGGDAELLNDLSPSSRQRVAALVAPTADGALEKLVGPADYVPIAYLDLARRASATVARLLDRHRRPLGTGVMVSPRLFMTNHHVIPDATDAAASSLQFDYQLCIDDIPAIVTEFRLDPTTFFWTSPVDDLDVSLIAVGPRLAGDKALEQFGFTPLSSAADKHAEGDFVSVIEHPDGDFKQIALRENRVVGRGASSTTLFYSADTLHGSSGSPVYNDEFCLVALHHAGGPRNDHTLDTGAPAPDDCNEGIRASAVVAALRLRHDDLPLRFRDLLAEALNPPMGSARTTATAPTPTPTIATATGVSAELILPELRIVNGRTIAAEAAATSATPDASPTSTPEGVPPIDVLSDGSPPTAGAMVLERNDAPETDYDKRRGYEPDFLPQAVALPTLPTALVKQCALPHGLRRSAANVVLRYHHFSLVIRADRRMPVYTIVNVDGRRLRSINRTTGEVEAAEIWYTDPRIDTDAQLGQEVFASQRPRFFDRGHMVRRLDPAWGSPATAKLSADDTFHFTNCCPQISAFNQHLWQGIENYALTNAGAEKKRITIITGPVFGADDPVYRDVAVPRAFWKIVIRVHAGRLRATGFIADQNAGLDAALGDGTEAFADLGTVAVFQAPIAQIASATALRFGTLADHDTMQVGLESAGPALTALDEVDW
ncbi:DNA/RNA non-specific endonuclease [Gordonia hankookensis]|uniref:Serine protease n=1 Tax=Gordonia hankookensis TaxID=589403 RepID=A0ABR7WFE6_9ACTN|nr:DNA/RNA non-specific endonuclease [Gordonia hankookensis]MBD1321483.1 DNA/RNA non-specific endonuclease [Gordonia hankookensis]